MQSLDGIIRITKPNTIKKDSTTAEDMFIFIAFILILIVIGVQLIISGLPRNNYCSNLSNSKYSDVKHKEHIVMPRCFDDTKGYIYENSN